MHGDIVLEVCKLYRRGRFKSLASITISKMLEGEEQKQGQVSPHSLALGHHGSRVLGALLYSRRPLGIPTPFGYLLGAGLEVPTLPPLDLQHIPNRSAVLACCRDSDGRISSGLRPGESLSTKKRWRESARGLEKGPRRSQVFQDMSRQPAAELRSYCRQLRRISPSFPHSSFQERLGEGR